MIGSDPYGGLLTTPSTTERVTLAIDKTAMVTARAIAGDKGLPVSDWLTREVHRLLAHLDAPG